MAFDVPIMSIFFFVPKPPVKFYTYRYLNTQTKKMFYLNTKCNSTTLSWRKSLNTNTLIDN